MTTRAWGFATTLITLVLASACGEVGSRSPSEVVEAAYMAANEGMYSETEQYLSSEVLNALRGDLGAMAGGLKGVWDDVTRNGNIERLEIIREDIRGEGATVFFRIHYKDGTTKEDDEPLIREDGQWKITIG